MLPEKLQQEDDSESEFIHPGKIPNHELVDGADQLDGGIDFPSEPDWQYDLKRTMCGLRPLRHTFHISHAQLCTLECDVSVTHFCVQLRSVLHRCATRNLGVAAQNVRRWPLHPTILPGDRD